tara:strand:+ start:366 stop:803 length:438 start_codon:yes stop_codon:yes gene_type:complete
MGLITQTDRLLNRIAKSTATSATDGATAKSSSNTTSTQITSQNARLFGQNGAILVTGTTAVTCGISDKVFVAIQFLEDTIFDSGAGGLIAETEQLFPDDTGTGTLIDADGGAAIDGITFPKGMTLYGRYTGFKLTATGKVIAYLG